jgi:hypothetical protein
MKTVRISLAMAASALALTTASLASAQERDTTTTTTTQDQPQQQPQQQQPQQQPQQSQPVQNVTVAPPPQQQPVVQQPVGQTTTTQAPYNPPSAESSEKTIEKRPHSTLLSTGVGLFVIGYGSSVVAGAVSNRDEDKNLFIPVVGPWMDLADRDCGSRGCGGNEDLAKAMIVTSGIVQGAGVIMGLSSLFIPETTSVKEERRSAAVKPTVRVTPVSFGAGAGAGVVGRF